MSKLVQLLRVGRRYATGIRNQAAPSISTVTSHQETPIWFGALATASILTSTIAATVSDNDENQHNQRRHSVAKCSPSPPSENILQIKKSLSPMLEKVRQNRPSKYSPPVSIEIIPNEGNANPTYMLHFQLHQQCNTIQLLSGIVASFPNDQLSFSNATDNEDNEELSMVFRGSTASFIISNHQLSFFTDDLPTTADLEAFTKAYEVGTIPRIADSYFSSSSIVDKENLEAMQDFFRNLPANFPKLEMPDGTMKRRKRDGEKGNTMNQNQAINELESLGCTVYGTTKDDSEAKTMEWNSLAGYEKVKEDVEATVLLALKHPETYERIARSTREKYESNRPKAILFEGPPGTGKTTTAKIIASQAGVPMVYVPVESICSKWYGESGKNLSKIFDACESLEDSIIFLDEVDALATKRGDSNMHEATRRTLSTLLRRLEGFKEKKSTIFVCATNRKVDLDPALLSRFDISVNFDLPNASSRELIFARYARQLSKDELKQISSKDISGGMAGRDIKEVCQAAERKWASMLILGKTKEYPERDEPPYEIYKNCSMDRIKSMTGSNGSGGSVGSKSRKEYGESGEEYSI
jgi:flagellar biosynthesis GTPase FlhF